MEPPKVIISYSWGNPEHENWVIELANRLRHDGVDASLDQWDLKDGMDVNAFMETMVKDQHFQNVIIILDQNYKRKADERIGGVGTETQFISHRVYKDVTQTKFIPVLREVDENGDGYIPTYLQSRLYIDLSSSADFEAGYERLLRNIHKRPQSVKPEIGKIPSYLELDPEKVPSTTYLLNKVKHVMTQNPERLRPHVIDLYEAFKEGLIKIEVKPSTLSKSDHGKAIYDGYQVYLPLRNDLLQFFDLALRNLVAIDFDDVHKFLEDLFQLRYSLLESVSISSTQSDFLRIIANEIYLYLIAIASKRHRFEFLAGILHKGIFVKRSFWDKAEYNSMAEFHCGFDDDTLKAYFNERDNKTWLSAKAKLYAENVEGAPISKDELAQADMLCHYIFFDAVYGWFPHLVAYSRNPIPDICSRIQSLSFFEKVKFVFNVNTIDQFKKLLAECKEAARNRHSVSRFNYDRYKAIYEVIDPDKIGIFP